jgi:hypothetical protein
MMAVSCDTRVTISTPKSRTRVTQYCGANKSRGDTNQFSGDAQSLLSDLITAAPKSEWLFAAQTTQGPSNTTYLCSCFVPAPH